MSQDETASNIRHVKYHPSTFNEQPSEKREFSVESARSWFEPDAETDGTTSVLNLENQLLIERREKEELLH